MAIDQIGTGKSLAWTAVGGQTPTPAAGPLSNIQKYGFSRNKELKEFLKGLARVQTRYSSTKTAAITVDSPDVDVLCDLEVGQKFTSVILTLQGAIDAGGTAIGGDVTVTLSHAVITAIGDLEHSNEDDTPAVQSVTFTLDRHDGESSDPTWTIAAA